ncbi:MAG: type II secretion system minor pseudopilin GspI [Arenicella sp.]|nr:type II secretion system minor pseudopilin GspI [Arenicella sp.]
MSRPACDMRLDAENGFTLIEIIVALAVVAIAVLSMMGSMSTHAHVSGELEKNVISRWVASNVIAETRYQAQFERIRIGRSSDTIRMGGHRWRARSTVAKTDVEQVFLLTVEVFDEDTKDDKPLSRLTTALAYSGEL